MISNKPQLTIVIPVHNAEKYLNRCLRSVINQTLKSIEVICVDDGSDDGSWGIISKFAKKDSRIVAIQQENKGAAIARNRALEAAKGEFIGFVDSDDFIDKDYFECLVSAAEQGDADIARGYIKTEHTSKGALGRPDAEYEDYFYNDVLKADIQRNKTNQRYVMWLAVYRRSLIADNSIEFPPDIRTGQDVLFNLKTGYYANKIVYSHKKVFYHRVVREGSLMTDYIYSDSGLLSRSRVLREVCNFLNSVDEYDKEIYVSHMLDAYNFIQDRLSHIESDSTADKIAEVVSDTWKRTRYKDEIASELKSIDYRFSTSLDSKEEIHRLIRDTAMALDGGSARVSIIIPVYNQEKYLDDCIKSVRAQTYKNIEIICVNDGSTDKSEAILNRYSYRDARITIINKDNGGVSTARNAGFVAARGKYVIFLDSDDSFDNNLVQKLYVQAEKHGADITVCNFTTYSEKTHKQSEPRMDMGVFRKKIVSYKTNPHNILDGLTLMFWNKLFRRQFLVDTKIMNNEKLHRAQDIDFVGRALVSTSKIAVVDESLVVYRTDTATSNVRKLYKYPDDVVNALSNLKDFLISKGIYEDLKKSFTVIAVDHLLAVLYFTETESVHKKIHKKAKLFLKDQFSDRPTKEDIPNDKTYTELCSLMEGSYEDWLRYRIRNLRNDEESAYISYLLDEFKRKYDDEVRARQEDIQKRVAIEESLSWRVTAPIRRVIGWLRKP